MRHVLLDTNVVLDVLLERPAWVTDAKTIWQAIDDGQLVGYITAVSLTNIFYIARRLKGLEAAHAGVRICLEAFEICTINRQLLEQASRLSTSDFEDNLQVACAEAYGLDAIVTRDPVGFRSASIPVLSPAKVALEI
jgi:predicted nucleic acid-binding protein